MTSIPMNRIGGTVSLVILWVLLVGEVTVGNVVAGIVVAITVLVAFPRRGTPTRHRWSPWRCAVLLGHLAVQLVISSCRVSMAVLRPTPARLQTAAVRVPMRTDSELVGTVVADLITLTPGTLTLDLRHDPQRLIVHALGSQTPAEVVESVHALEDRVLKAITPVAHGTSDQGSTR